MKLETRSNPIETVGVTPKRMTITANAKAFNALAKDVYSNPIKAIVRELCCNAADSLNMAGKSSTPFVVHLPNQLEPFFEVTDDGCGLSADDVQNIYGSLFASNKTERNDATGCFGIGSKSPFAYVQNFMICTRYNGHSTIYAVHKDEEDCPCVTSMGDVPTDLPNGFSVKVAVKSSDFYRFSDHALEVLAYFENPFKVVGASFEITKNKPIRETSDYAYLGYGQSLLVMANVAYPISANNLGLAYDESHLYTLLSNGIILKVPNGAVNFALSRETLQYDVKTIKYIKTKLTEARNDLEKYYHEAFEKSVNLFAAYCNYEEMGGKLSFLFKNQFGHNGFNWKGKYYNRLNGDIIKKDWDINVSRIELKTLNYKRVIGNIRVDFNKTAWILDDLKIGGYSRYAKYLRDNKLQQGLLIEADNDPLKVKLFLDYLGMSVPLTSALPKPPVTKRGSNGKSTKSLMYKFKDQSESCTVCIRSWVAEQVDLKTGGVYVVIDRFAWHDSKGIPTNTYYLKNLLNRFEKLGYARPVVYGVRKSDVSKLANLPWTCLHDFIKATLKKDLPSRLKDQYAINEHNYLLQNTATILQNLEHSSLAKQASHPVMQLIAKVQPNKAVQPYNQGLTNFFNFCKTYGIEVNYEKTPKKVMREYRKVVDKYPLLAILQKTTDTKICEAVVQYVEAIDKHGT